MKWIQHGLALSGLATLAAAQACQQGVHIIVARASGEPVGFGGLVILKNQLLALIPNSDAVAVPYPASIGGAIVYTVSEPEGVSNATQLITRYGDACPDSKMVLMGYSQGAQVMADTLLGIDYDKFPAFGSTKGLDQKYIDNIVAVVMMGDPSNVAGNPVLFGTAKHSGFFPRNNTDEWAQKGLVNKTRSYCDANDYFCDKGNSITVHVGYVAEYGTQAVKFVVDKFKASMAGSDNGAGTGSISVSSVGGPAGVPSTAAPSATTAGPSSSPSDASSTPTQGSASSTPAGTSNGATGTPTPTGTGAAASLKADSMSSLLLALLSCALAVAI